MEKRGGCASQSATVRLTCVQLRLVGHFSFFLERSHGVMKWACKFLFKILLCYYVCVFFFRPLLCIVLEDKGQIVSVQSISALFLSQVNKCVVVVIVSGGTATLWDLLGAVIFLFSKRLGIVMQCGLRYFAGNVHGPIFFSVGLCKSETPERTFALFRKRCQGEEVTVFFSYFVLRIRSGWRYA